MNPGTGSTSSVPTPAFWKVVRGLGGEGTGPYSGQTVTQPSQEPARGHACSHFVHKGGATQGQGVTAPNPLAAPFQECIVLLGNKIKNYEKTSP